MGKFFSYVCQKCSHKYRVQEGVGFAFVRVYQSVLQEIKDGKYGSEWQEEVTKDPHITFNFDSTIYVCRCGGWSNEPDLSLYRPKNPEKCSDESCFLPAELNKNFTLVKRYVHRCPKCHKRMHKARGLAAFSLSCPKCGAKNVAKDFGWHD